MRDLWRFLTDNPIVLILLATWMIGMVGKLMQSIGEQARKAAREAGQDVQRRRAEQRQETTTLPAMQVDRTEPRPTPPPIAPNQRRPVTSEEAIEEMRRILTGQGTPRPSGKQTPPPPRVRLVPSHQPSQPMVPSQLGRMAVHVDPHVGEAAQRRRSPGSGQVGGHEMGGLGGRGSAPALPMGPRRKGLLDLRDLKRAFVLREVLGPPVALREGWGEPGGVGRVT